MPTIKIDITGANNCLDEKQLLASLFTGMQDACFVVESAAKDNCPVDTGVLRASIKSDVKTEGTQVIGEVGTNLSYAPYIHYGTGLFAEDGNGRKDVPWVYQDAAGEWHATSGQPPKPFLRNAVNSNRARITQILQGAVKL